MKRALKLILSLAITGVCFWWTFKDTRWDEMWASLRTANYLWVLPYLGILLGIHLMRTLRWGSLLSGMDRVPFWKLNQAAGIGFMMLIVLPFRLGEFARPFLIAQRSKVRRSAAMMTVVLERIIDGVSIAMLLRALLFFMPEESDQLRHVRWGANLMFAVFGGGLLFLLFAAWQRERAVRFVRATAGRISPSLGEKAAEIVGAFVGALKQLPGPLHLFAFFLFTAVYWSLNGFGMSVLARAFDCNVGGAAVCAPLTLSVFEGFVLLSVLVVGLMIPAAPGSAGTFQAFVLLGLSLFLPKTVVNASGIAYANVLWLIQMVQQIGVGLLLLLFSRDSFSGIAGKLGEANEDAETAMATPAPESRPRRASVG